MARSAAKRSPEPPRPSPKEAALELFATGAFVTVASLRAHCKGLKAADAKAALDALVREGAAKRALRTKVETYAPPTARVVEGAAVRDLVKLLDQSRKIAAKAANAKRPNALLVADVEPWARALDAILQNALQHDALQHDAIHHDAIHHDAKSMRSAGDAASNAAQPNDVDAHLIEALRSAHDRSTGLAFVPEMMRSLERAGIVDARSTILSAASRGLLELRPEGGLARLSDADRSLCPTAPDGTPLSWARDRSASARRDEGDSR